MTAGECLIAEHHPEPTGTPLVGVNVLVWPA